MIISLSNIRQIWFICYLMHDDAVFHIRSWLHMWSLVSSSPYFEPDLRRHVIAPLTVHQKESQKILLMAGKELTSKVIWFSVNYTSKGLDETVWIRIQHNIWFSKMTQFNLPSNTWKKYHPHIVTLTGSHILFLPF